MSHIDAAEEVLVQYRSELRTHHAGGTRSRYGADDRARTGDLDLGKVALYQLSYVRVNTHISPQRALNQPR
jgi:hypothetical protein